MLHVLRNCNSLLSRVTPSCHATPCLFSFCWLRQATDNLQSARAYVHEVRPQAHDQAGFQIVGQGQSLSPMESGTTSSIMIITVPKIWPIPTWRFHGWQYDHLLGSLESLGGSHGQKPTGTSQRIRRGAAPKNTNVIAFLGGHLQTIGSYKIAEKWYHPFDIHIPLLGNSTGYQFLVVKSPCKWYNHDNPLSIARLDLISISDTYNRSRIYFFLSDVFFGGA